MAADGDAAGGEWDVPAVMLTAALAILVATPPMCDTQIGWTWPAHALSVVKEGALRVRAITWVSPKRDAFVLELGGRRVFIGRASKVREVVNVEGWSKEQVELQLPLAQGAIELNENGGTRKGCEILQKSIDLGGPLAAGVPIDARSGWRFEIRDRSMQQVLLRF